MLRDVEEGSARSSPAHPSPAAASHTLGSKKKKKQKGPLGVQNSPIMPSISHRPEHFQNDF